MRLHVVYSYGVTSALRWLADDAVIDKRHLSGVTSALRWLADDGSSTLRRAHWARDLRVA